MQSNRYRKTIEQQLILRPKRSRKSLKRKRKVKQSHVEAIRNIQRRRNLQQNLLSKTYKKIVVPQVFSLLGNYDEVSFFFKTLETSVDAGLPVFLELTKIKMISVDTLMYLLACLKRFRGRKVAYNIQGNKPHDPRSAKIFEESGFYSFISKSPGNKRSTDVRPIYEGTQVLGSIAKDMCDFVQTSFGWNRLQTKGLYDVLLELMTNTVQHAKSYITSDDSSQWLVYAQHDSGDHSITFCFLDLGEGIPATVRKTYGERILEFLSGESLSDAGLVNSALSGKFRTQTNQGYRGKGLPTIYRYFQNGQIHDLAIISNGAFLQKGNSRNTKIPITGTLFIWKVRQ